MSELSRRTFLKLSGTAAIAAVPDSLRNVLRLSSDMRVP